MLEEALRADLDLQSFLQVVRDPAGFNYFGSHPDAVMLAEHLSATLPGWKADTVRAANRIAGGVIRVLGDDEFTLEKPSMSSVAAKHPPTWHEDQTNNYRWDPSTYYKDVPIPYGRAEAKVPWEISRFQHLPTLGMAYVATGSDHYAAAATAQIEDWLDNNLPGYGINWACTMDVALRAVNWLWTFRLIQDAPSVTDEFLTRFFASLSIHATHTCRNLEIYERGLTTNHTIADYLGLLSIGLACPFFEGATSWASEGADGMVTCMSTQVASDGVDFENSIPYHRLALEMFLNAHILGMQLGRPLSASYQASLERMLEFTHHYTRPDGLAPLVGDSDDGRVQILHDYFDWHPQDHRYLLAVGAEIFDRQDFARASDRAPGVDEDVAWLLGRTRETPTTTSAQSPRQRSRAFPVSGRYVMRENDHYAIVSADAVGTGGMGNHKHNDIFSYELCVSGVSFVVDPGSYLYASSEQWRNAFRSTRAHNTLMVCGVEQNEMSDVFQMRADARVEVSRWQVDNGIALFDASHSGYERLPQPTTHRRRICLSREPFAWLVLDSLGGSSPHEVESFVHFHNESIASVVADPSKEQAFRITRTIEGLCEAQGTPHIRQSKMGAVAVTRSGVSILLVPLNCTSMRLERGWVAPRWGQKVSAPVVSLGTVLQPGEPFGYLLIHS